jgi:hypothetical protein
MKERAVTFGSHNGLVGILCEPDGGPRPGALPLILFNIGLNHRVGPGRFNVELAREVAARGIPSLRFDLAGLGDSEPRGDSRTDEERAVLDLVEAMDFLGKRGSFDGYVVLGLCSGTDGAHSVAVSDPRVRGAVFIDGYAYETPSYRFWRVVEKAQTFVRPARLAQFLRRRLRRLRGLAGDVDAETAVAEPIFDRTFPPPEQFRRDLEALSARGAHALFVYTADAYFLNRLSQFTRMVGWTVPPAGVEAVHWTDVDHLFSAVPGRASAVGALASWVEGILPKGGATS